MEQVVSPNCSGSYQQPRTEFDFPRQTGFWVYSTKTAGKLISWGWNKAIPQFIYFFGFFWPCLLSTGSSNNRFNTAALLFPVSQSEVQIPEAMTTEMTDWIVFSLGDPCLRHISPVVLAYLSFSNPLASLDQVLGAKSQVTPSLPPHCLNLCDLPQTLWVSLLHHGSLKTHTCTHTHSGRWVHRRQR